MKLLKDGYIYISMYYILFNFEEVNTGLVEIDLVCVALLVLR